MEEEDEVTDIREQIFHNTVREYIHEINPDYQNTSNNFDSGENRAEKLLERCELLLKQFEKTNPDGEKVTTSESSYLDMSRKNSVASSTPATTKPNEYVLINQSPPLSVDNSDGYESCMIAADTSTRIVDENEGQNCPFSGLPAAHLAIKKSPKQGQLIRIGKRFIFDQSKKYFCGILGDWLLCYSDGPTAIKPSLCIQLSGAGIEHYGEGKRRDLCFQISNPDTSKKYIFQSISEIDAKMWIHAIEAIRGENHSEAGTMSLTRTPLKFQSNNNNLRKLPTPPVQMKFGLKSNREILRSNSNEDIYEEPCPLYNLSEISTMENVLLTEKIIRYDYDVPKRSPRQPVDMRQGAVVPVEKVPIDLLQVHVAPVETTSAVLEPAEMASEVLAPVELDPVVPEPVILSTDLQHQQHEQLSSTQIEFQAKFKEVQTKLDNQLPHACSPEALKSPLKSTSPSPKKQCDSSIQSTSTAAIEVARNSPVRNWFLNRLNKAGTTQVSFKQPDRKGIDRIDDGIAFTSPASNQNRILSTTAPKGEKVNKIINQLEANGRLPNFKGNKNNRRRRLRSTLDSKTDDSNNYESIFLLLFLLLYLGSYALIVRFRRKDREDLYSTDDDEILVYRISLWLCTFSMAVAVGAALLLPISIASNEVLLLYPNSYYVKWLNSSLIQGLWNQIFLFSNLSLFVFLPFAYLFTESSGFCGHKNGVVARAYETFTVFSLLAFVVLGLAYVLSALFDPEKSGILSLLNLSSVHLPFLYSCVSFLGVLLLLVCTPFGFVRLFGVLGQVLVKPHLLRDVNEEFQAFHLEEASVKRKLANINTNSNIELQSVTSYQPNGRGIQNGLESLYQRKTTNGVLSENAKLHERLRELESERKELDKLRSSSALQRNFVYPLAMLLLLFLTGITVLLVLQNTLELLIGIKALPLSTRQLTLGISSLSKLGAIGAALEVCIIFYLGATSAVGLYTMPFMRNVKPQKRKTSLSQLIFNCALVLILSSALPLLSRILGISNFDLLGDFGAIEWLGNFQIVLLYNLIFGTTTALCLANKFTAAVRRELCARLRSILR